MRAMVLAAGLGTRLRPLTYELNKPMVPVLDRPVMEHILDLLDEHGFEEVIANIHHFPDSIREHFGERLSYSFEPELLGTAGGVRNCAAFLGSRQLPGDLGGRPHGHRSERPRGPPPADRRDRDAGGQAGPRHARVRGRAARPRGPRDGLPGEARPAGGALGPRELRHLHVQAGDLRLLPGRGLRRLGPRRPAGAAGATTSRFTSTSSRSTGTTSVRSRSCAKVPSTRSPGGCGCRSRARRSSRA